MRPIAWLLAGFMPLVGFGNWWLCLAWPWHRLTLVKRLSGFSDHVCCERCGREFGINHDVRAILPWEEVEAFYRERDADIAALAAQSK